MAQVKWETFKQIAGQMLEDPKYFVCDDCWKKKKKSVSIELNTFEDYWSVFEEMKIHQT